MVNRFADPTEEKITPSEPPVSKGKNRFADEETDSAPKSPWQEYQDMPWYKQLTTALDDMAMLGASGITFGAGEGLAKATGNTKFLDEMNDRRQRAGIPGIGMEITGSAVSPITRMIMGAGKFAVPSERLLPSLVRGAGEGGALGATGSILSGNPEDIVNDATVGAALGPGMQLFAKGAGALTRGGLSWLTGLYPDVFSTAYKAGKDVGPIEDALSTSFKGPSSYAFKQGRGEQGKTVHMDQAEAELASNLGEMSGKTIDKRWALDRLQTVFDRTKTESGMSKLTRAEFNQAQQMKNYVNDFMRRPGSIEDSNALIEKLSSFRASKSPVIRDLAEKTSHILTNATARTEPRYTNAIEKFRDSKDAYQAGKASKRIMPHGLPSTMVAGGGAALSFLHNPMLGLAATVGGGLASSPRVTANAAHLLGKSRGILNLLGIDPAKLGLFAYQRQERSGR